MCPTNFSGVCGDGRCIHSLYICDAYEDCYNGEDERGCSKSCWSVHLFSLLLLFFSFQIFTLSCLYTTDLLLLNRGCHDLLFMDILILMKLQYKIMSLNILQMHAQRVEYFVMVELHVFMNTRFVMGTSTVIMPPTSLSVVCMYRARILECSPWRLA